MTKEGLRGQQSSDEAHSLIHFTHANHTPVQKHAGQ